VYKLSAVIRINDIESPSTAYTADTHSLYHSSSWCCKITADSAI